MPKKPVRIPARMLLYCYAAASVCLLLYSYTQVDLGLTITSSDTLLRVLSSFQHIGYFRRPLSTALYLILLAVLFVLYAVSLRMVKQKKLTERDIWRILAVVVPVLLFSYPAFSHDLFNYMFTAKTVLVYGKNPYEVIPLQFEGIDPWLGFMRWTHLPSAYAPLWIGITIPFFLLGFGLFLPTLYSFKLIAALGYLSACYYLLRSMRIQKSALAPVSLALFALNPLVIVESLVSGHNDIVMMALAMAAYYLYLKRERFFSYIALACSAGLKLMTLPLLLLYVTGWKRRHALYLMIASFAAVLLVREVLPWYLLWILPFAALVPERTEYAVLSFGASAGLLLRYAPYLYYGHWDSPVPILKTYGTLLPVAVAAVYVLCVKFVRSFGT